AIFLKRGVARVCAKHALGVLYWTPILLGPRSNLAHIGDDAIDVRAIGAVEFFQRVQIGQSSAIENDVAPAFDLRDAVGTKAKRLVERHPKIKHYKWNDQRIDDRRREDDKRARPEEITSQPHAQSTMAADHF